MVKVERIDFYFKLWMRELESQRNLETDEKAYFWNMYSC